MGILEDKEEKVRFEISQQRPHKLVVIYKLIKSPD